MTAETSPRPWRAEQPGDECRFWTIRTPDGVSVCTAWREAANAALIIEAVNERDRLRDALERIIDATYDTNRGCPDFRAIARAALGKDKP